MTNKELLKKIRELLKTDYWYCEFFVNLTSSASGEVIYVFLLAAPFEAIDGSTWPVKFIPELTYTQFAYNYNNHSLEKAITTPAFYLMKELSLEVIKLSKGSGAELKFQIGSPARSFENRPVKREDEND